MKRITAALLLCFLWFPSGAVAATLDELIAWYNESNAKKAPPEALVTGLTRVIEDRSSNAATVAFALGLRARVKVDSGNTDGGLVDARRAVATDDTVHEAHHALGRALEASCGRAAANGDYAQAAEKSAAAAGAFTQAAARVKDPEWKTFYQQRAMAMEVLAGLNMFSAREREYLTGKIQYGEFLAASDLAMLQAEKSDAFLAYVHARRAGAHFMEGETARAKSDALAAIAINKNSYEGHRVLSYVYEKEGDEKMAVASAEKASTLAPEPLRRLAEIRLSQLRLYSAAVTKSPRAREERCRDVTPDRWRDADAFWRIANAECNPENRAETERAEGTPGEMTPD